MKCEVAVFIAAFSVACAQFFAEPFQSLPLAIQPPPVQRNTFQPIFSQASGPSKRITPHRDVVVNAENEARLPAELINDFYKNPRIAQALAKESWFIPGEEQVVNREAEKIPRGQVAKLLRQAGFIRRR